MQVRLGEGLTERLQLQLGLWGLTEGFGESGRGLLCDWSRVASGRLGAAVLQVLLVTDRVRHRPGRLWSCEGPRRSRITKHG